MHLSAGLKRVSGGIVELGDFKISIVTLVLFVAAISSAPAISILPALNPEATAMAECQVRGECILGPAIKRLVIGS